MESKDIKPTRCRFCLTAIKEDNKEGILKLICENAECTAKLGSICNKKAGGCSHPCQGYPNEPTCLPCLDKECPKRDQQRLRDQDLNASCSICLEEFRYKACVLLKNAHTYSI
jgi:hypothetical protein